MLRNIENIELNHLGLLRSIEVPTANGNFEIITNIDELNRLSTEDSSKKADIYINGIGVSLKQSGASFPYNRIQRAEILDVFTYLDFEEPYQKLYRIDKEINDFHNGALKGRSRPWENLFSEEEFKSLVEFRMMRGSPNLGFSKHPAKFILEAPSSNINIDSIKVFTFDEYFEHFKNNLFFAIRRQWIGQSSNSEHYRAVSLSKKPGNKKWIYKDIAGEPRISKITGKRWRDEVPVEQRRTVYMIFIEKG